MRTYESIFIVHPDITGDAYTAVVEKFKGVLTDQGAEILKSDEWGTRKLAYPIRKQTRGTYVLLVFDAASGVVAEYERRMRIDDSIMKFQTLLLENGLEEVPAAAEAEGEGGESEESETTETENA